MGKGLLWEPPPDSDSKEEKPMRKYILPLLGIVISAGIVQSAPPHPNLLDRIARGEIAVPNDNRTISNAELVRMGFAPILNRANPLAKPAGPTGQFRILVALVDFSDKVAQAPTVYFDSLLFSKTQSSVNRFYSENSYGILDLVTINYPSSTGWRRAPDTYAWYVDSQFGLGAYPQNAQGLVEDVVDLINPFVNFANYDNDGDGRVDAFTVVHSGQGAEYTGSPNDIWSHKWAIPPKLADGVRVFDYNMEPEYWNAPVPGDMTVGVFCHELGHVFGLPDLYDTDGGSQGIGRWSVMAGGTWNGSLGSSPAHFDAWCKTRLGFAAAAAISTNQTGVKIPNAEQSNTGFFRLWTNGTIGPEYFLVENRQRTGYDAGLPSAGLLIWHIDDTISTSNTKPWFPPNSPTNNHYQVGLVQADNLWQLEQNISSGNAGDPYPGSTLNRNFSPTTAPNSNSYYSSNTLVRVENISNSGDTMTADLSVRVPTGINDQFNRPVNFTLSQNYPNPFNPNTVISYSLQKSGSLKIDVFNMLGEKVKTLFDGSEKAGLHQISWNGTDETGRTVSSGLYFYRLKFEDIAQTKKMTLLH